jgi:hypothetical protein
VPGVFHEEGRAIIVIASASASVLLKIFSGISSSSCAV